MLIAAGLTGALIAILVSGSLGHQRSGQNQLPGLPGDLDDPVLRVLDPSQPLMPSGREVSLREAQAESAYEIYLPSSDLVDDRTLEVWFSSTTSEVATRYNSTLVLEYDPWEQGQSPAEEYTQQAKTWNAGEATEIAGNPAWVIPADAQGKGAPPVPTVHVSMGGLDITMYGQMSLDELIMVAETLRPAPTSGVVPGGSA